MTAKQSIETLLASIWSRREVGINLPTEADLFRRVTKEDVEYLSNYRYPFLQIMNTEADFSEEGIEPNFISLPNGWVIFDYKDAISSSYSTKRLPEKKSIVAAATSEAAGGEIAALGKKEEGESGEGGEGGKSGDGGGTIIKQQFETALAMIEEAKAKGWAAVEIIGGNMLMKFYAWVAAQELEIVINGFSPTNEQKSHYKNLLKFGVVSTMRKEIEQQLQLK